MTRFPLPCDGDRLDSRYRPRQRDQINWLPKLGAALRSGQPTLDD